MGFKKFDSFGQGRYWKAYMQDLEELFKTVQQHFYKVLAERKTIGLDVGAGPGVAARLLADLGLDTTVFGYEPSKTHDDGIELSTQLKRDSSPTIYIPQQGGIEAINNFPLNHLDYISMMRAAHEIAESLHGKEKFFQELTRIAAFLKRSGTFIIAEPHYIETIASQPQLYSDLIQEVQRYQLKNFGHSHVSSDYVTSREMEHHLQSIGFQISRKDQVQFKGLSKHLQEKGYTLDSSPIIFYVETLVRK